MKNTITWLIIILIVLIGGYLLLTPSTPTEAGPIKIGVMAPFSGNAAVIGEKIRIGIDRAILEINEDKKLIEIVYEDNGNDPKMAVSGMRKLIDIDKIDLVITSMSGTSLAILPLAEENNIPVIATVVYVDVPARYENSVQFFIKPKAEAEALVNAIESLGIKKIGLLYLNNDYGVAIRDDIETMLADSGVVLDTEGYDMSDNTFKTQLAKLNGKGIDTLYAITFPHTVGTIIKEATELGFEGKIITNAPIYLNGLLGTNEILNNTYTSVPFVYTDTEKTGFFEREFGTKYPAGNAYLPYDVLKIIGEEIEKGTTISEMTSSISGRGVIETSVHGKLNIDSETKSIDIPLAIMKIKNGEFVKYEPETTEE